VRRCVCEKKRKGERERRMRDRAKVSCCSVLQCVAVRCSALQCDAVCCSVLWKENKREQEGRTRDRAKDLDVFSLCELYVCG